MFGVTGLVVLLLFLFRDVTSLRNVSLSVRPTPVQKGNKVELHCSYDLEKEPLYSVKWYRGTHEFYRYSPTDQPLQKIFQHDKFPQIVDTSLSNATQVVLREVQLNLTGNVTCEVTTDVKFITSMASNTLEVVDLPTGPPTIKTNLPQNKYQMGDLLEANCTAPPSSHVIGLTMHINNDPVGRPDMQQQIKMADPDGTISFLPVSLHLNASYFQNSQLVVTCTGIFKTLYRQTATIYIGMSNEPIPARVTSKSSNNQATVTVLTLLIYYYMLR
uniref:Ig-like domain-containing protein n=1 Tax=Clastoptera arizonana TaxID=38151 RepID=A0A1B6DVU8_9HEMI